MKPPVIPKFEPEIVAAIAKRKYHGDSEKVAATSIKALDVHGVSLRSRYDKAHEYAEMAAMVEGVLPELRGLIKSIWCDSKANACYSVWLAPCTTNQARKIGRQITAACIAHGGGHNGISIQGPNRVGFDIAPSWDEP